MIHYLKQPDGTRLPITRRHPGNVYECVNPKTGAVVLVDSPTPEQFETFTPRVDPFMEDFDSRPPGWLERLRERRIEALAESRTKRRSSTPKKKKSPSKRKPKLKLTGKAAEGLELLSPEVRARLGL